MRNRGDSFRDLERLFLVNDTARTIFESIEPLPVIDIHTHIDLRQVVENASPADPWTALCAGDHYVSSVMESLGAMDRRTFYDPATDPFEKWAAFAAIFPRLPGNPIRDWMRMTLASLGVAGRLDRENARALWEELAEILMGDGCRPAEVFRRSPAALIATTDNPVDSLEWIDRAETMFPKGYWRPTWRPDAFLHLAPSPIAPKRWIDWVEDLERVAGEDLKGRFRAFLDALAARHAFFASRGCRASDYGVSIPAGHDVSFAAASLIFDTACRRGSIAPAEALDFQAFLMRYSMDLDFEKGWVSQIHFGPARNLRRVAADHGGIDSGCDTIHGHPDVVHSLCDLLNHFDSAGPRHHKIVLYSSSATEWDKVAGLSRIFPGVYSGMAWWYYDSPSGMGDFLSRIPDIGAGFLKIAPFVTDTRNIYSFLPRTQMYRRCLASALARLVEWRGESLDDVMALGRQLCVDHPQRMMGCPPGRE